MGFNQPVRRLLHPQGGAITVAPQRMRGQLGALGQVNDAGPPQALNPAQIADLLSRNPDLANRIPGVGCTDFWIPGVYSSSCVPPSGSWGIGMQVDDAVYGRVLVSQDAVGRWHYIANSPVATNLVNQPPYVSPLNPPGQASCTDSITDFLGCFQQYAGLALLLVGGYVVYRMAR